ncbi:glycosyltransferase family 4 protein [Candidatus Puniceispirillum sp.]|nr:glycosyltransferase family 4 protein [Candidatus Puniceispirillum sp.]
MKTSDDTLNIDILLPAKEAFTSANAGAVATYVHDITEASTSGHGFKIFGRAVNKPFPDMNFAAVKPKMAWLFGQNMGFAMAYLHQLNLYPKPDLIEIHGRCNVASYIAAKRPDIPVTLFLPNDPRDMKGSKTIAERKNLLGKLAQIICVSHYIKDCFLDGLSLGTEESAKVCVFPIGVSRRLKTPPQKETIIFLAGRMVPEKGILECAQALADILPSYPEWRLVIAGARRFEQTDPNSYEARVAKAIEPLGNQAEMTGFIPLDKVRDWQERAAIAACPSLWQEPLGKVVVEALAAGCAVLTTRRGGIPEVAEGRALIIDKPSVATFRDGFAQLLKDNQFRHQLQSIAFADFPFTNTAMANKVDALRQAAFDAARHGHQG